MARPPITDDAKLLEVMGTDQQQWASSYLRTSFGSTGDRLHHLTANWFAAAIRMGQQNPSKETLRQRWDRLLADYHACDTAERQAVEAGDDYQQQMAATRAAFDTLMATPAPDHAGTIAKLRALLEFNAGGSLDDDRFDPIIGDIERLGWRAGETA